MIPALFSTFAIAVGLAMDAFSVSLAGGAALKKDIAKTALLTALMFGFFQFAMPVLGWVVGAPISSIINPFEADSIHYVCNFFRAEKTH